MGVLSIVKYPDPLLRQVSKPVDQIDDDVRALSQDMLDTVYAAKAAGLAAVQVGSLLRLMVTDVSYRDGEPAPHILFNPEIVETSDEQSTYQEGCLSVGDFRGEVRRPATISVRYLDVEGNEKVLAADGLLATCIQHEIDHMDGVLFLDYLPAEERDAIVSQVLAEQEKTKPLDEPQDGGTPTASARKSESIFGKHDA
ncbi:peptide deformylase [Phyllobacterium phragmitis]|uniref:Peptide deformylase n=1 Tax=Phyllobacterium phragmitis TaxID=2670329 RepID=A0A2S9IN49_9HYPH|nr:peptide deformylase [Phyllobacterium phragmitis]PRD41912.1 peptide deformylase [Phyllobacterium phragmitis]